MKRSRAALLLAPLLAVTFAIPAPAQTTPAQDDQKPAASKPAESKPTSVKLSRRERKNLIAALPEGYRQFLDDVEPIITTEEVDIFLRLESDAQRDAFIDEFWSRRDKANKEAPGAFRQIYYDRLEQVKEKYRNSDTDQGRFYLIQGAPNDVVKADFCDVVWPIEIWYYGYLPGFGTDAKIVFYSHGGDYHLWGGDATSAFRGSKEALKELLTSQGEKEGVEAVFFGRFMMGRMAEPPLVTHCPHGKELLDAIRWADGNRSRISRTFLPKPINEEDVQHLLNVTVIANPSAKKLDVETSVKFAGARGSRTITEITMLVPRGELTVHGIGNERFYNLDVTGETIKNGRLYERWRYRFDYPAAETSDVIPAVIERHLRPADYTLRIRLADANANAEAIIERPITVPPPVENNVEARAAGRKEIANLLSTAGDNVVRIAPLPEGMLTGLQRIEAIVTGDRIASVDFYLDDRKIMTKTRAPWTLELDLGPVPRTRHVKAIAYDAKGNVVDGDQVTVNAGIDPFRVHIVSPRFQQNLSGRVRVEIAVSVPSDAKLDKVDLYLGDRKVGEMFNPPFVQWVSLPKGGGLAYLRAVATLKNSARPPQEDVVIVNSPEFLQQVEVRLVELPTSVLRDGRPVPDLPKSAFHVFVEKKPVKIAKFEYIRNLKLSIGMAVDSSASMQKKMAEAQKAGRAFFQSVMKPGDRAFVVAFDRDAYFAQKWTSSIDELTSGLASLRAEESTALWDAILYSLYNFEGVRGQRALVVISDGADTSSRFTYAQALEYAKRRGIPIYVVGIGIRATEIDVRTKLDRIAKDTGGNAWFIDTATDLNRIYGEIEQELRSQYLLGFYSPDDPGLSKDWRPIRVEVDGADAKTISGYYP